MRRLSTTAAALLACLSLSCAGAVWSDAEGHAFAPVALGNAEYASEHLCLAGGPISDGAVQGIVELVRVGLSLLMPGLSQQAPNASQDTPREAGCFETQAAAEAAGDASGLTLDVFVGCVEQAGVDRVPAGSVDGVDCTEADLDGSGQLTVTDFGLLLDRES